MDTRKRCSWQREQPVQMPHRMAVWLGQGMEGEKVRVTGARLSTEPSDSTIRLALPLRELGSLWSFEQRRDQI